MTFYQRAGKRLFDIAFALAVLVAAAPLIAVVAVLIRRDSPGPGVFAQARVGRGGAVFTCYKLRSMRIGTANVATHEMTRADITPLGQWIRRYKVDELPQFWNVLKGEMSVVGPRPCLPTQTELVAARAAAGVLTVRPGISGRAQVMGVDMTYPLELAAIDADYVRTINFREDLRLIFRTVVK